MPLSRPSAVVVFVINKENDDAATYIYIYIYIYMYICVISMLLLLISNIIVYAKMIARQNRYRDDILCFKSNKQG